jgi:hypothetical protein
VAHCVAVFTLGVDGFIPLLCDKIRSDFGESSAWPDRYLYVGNHPHDVDPHDARHALGWDIISSAGRALLVVWVRLFASLGAPVFQVVVGELTPAQQGGQSCR